MTYKKRAAFMAAAVSASSLLLVPTAEAVENTSKTAAKAQPGVTVSEKASVESTGSKGTQPGITAVEKKSQPGTTSPAVPVETPKDAQSQEAETAESVESPVQPVPVEEPAAVVPQAPVVEAVPEDSWEPVQNTTPVTQEPVVQAPAYTPEPAPLVEAAGVDTYEAAETPQWPKPQQQVVDYTPQAPVVQAVPEDSWEPVQNTTPVTQEPVVQAPQSQAESQITASDNQPQEATAKNHVETSEPAAKNAVSTLEAVKQDDSVSPAVPVETPKDAQSQEAETAESVESPVQPVPVEEPAAVVPQAPVVEAVPEDSWEPVQNTTPVTQEPVVQAPAYTPEPAPLVEAAGVDTYEAAETPQWPKPQQQVVDYTPQAPVVQAVPEDSWEPVQNTTPVTQEPVVQAPQSQAESQITAFIGDVASNVQEAVQNLESGQSADTSDVDTVTPADS